MIEIIVQDSVSYDLTRISSDKRSLITIRERVRRAIIKRADIGGRVMYGTSFGLDD